MNTKDLLLILENQELSKALINILSKEGDSTKQTKQVSLESAILGETETNLFGETKSVVPNISDLRNKGYQAPSKFVKDYIFPIGKRFEVWWDRHDSSLRNAFYRAGLVVSMDSLVKNKKYGITIMGTLPAKKKSA